MTDDEANAAQKAIDDAAKSADPALSPVALPQEPEPEPTVTQTTTTEQPVPEKPADVPVTTPAAPQINETGEKLVSDLLEPTTVAAPAPVHSPDQKPLAPSGGMKKKSAKGAIIAVIAMLLLTLPVAVYFISQQNQQLSDLRSRATGTNYTGCKTGPGYECCSNNPLSCGGHPEQCHCQGGNDCTGTKCEDIGGWCTGVGRSWCTNAYGFGKTCCAEGYSCCTTMNGCCGGGGDDNGDDDDNTNPTRTPTPTTGTAPVCQNIKIYKGNAQVTNPSTLRAGDVVTLAVKGNLSPTKAHFRVNGGSWTETTTKNGANEHTLSYTIPEGVEDFVIEGEVFTNGAWH